MTDPWTPEQGTYTPWTVEANTAAAWPPEGSSYVPWPVETLGDTPRITEDAAYIRITEQGNIRIIESKPFSWINESSNPINPWTQE